MTDLEQRIKEAAEKATPGEWRSPWLPGSKQKCAGVEAVGSHYIVIHIDKDGSYHPDTIEMWKRDCAYIALASPANILVLLAEKDAERDEWKRIAGRYRRSRRDCIIRKVGANGTRVDDRCDICKAYDALVKGE